MLCVQFSNLSLCRDLNAEHSVQLCSTYMYKHVLSFPLLYLLPCLYSPLEKCVWRGLIFKEQLYLKNPFEFLMLLSVSDNLFSSSMCSCTVLNIQGDTERQCPLLLNAQSKAEDMVSTCTQKLCGM